MNCFLKDIYKTVLQLESHSGKYANEVQKIIFERVCTNIC